MNGDRTYPQIPYNVRLSWKYPAMAKEFAKRRKKMQEKNKVSHENARAKKQADKVEPPE